MSLIRLQEKTFTWRSWLPKSVTSVTLRTWQTRNGNKQGQSHSNLSYKTFVLHEEGSGGREDVIHWGEHVMLDNSWRDGFSLDYIKQGGTADWLTDTQWAGRRWLSLLEGTATQKCDLTFRWRPSSSATWKNKSWTYILFQLRHSRQVVL